MSLLLRLLWVYFRALRRSPLTMTDPIELDFRVLPNDLDINGHMNNGRYMTILDLAIVDAVVRSGFLKAILSLGGRLMEGGTLVTYRGQLKPLMKYKLRMRYLGCDQHWHVFAFQFVRPDGKIAANGLLKGAGVRKRKGLIGRDELFAQFSALSGHPVVPPELPDHAKAWLALELETHRAGNELFKSGPHA